MLPNYIFVQIAPYCLDCLLMLDTKKCLHSIYTQQCSNSVADANPSTLRWFHKVMKALLLCDPGKEQILNPCNHTLLSNSFFVAYVLRPTQMAACAT